VLLAMATMLGLAGVLRLLAAFAAADKGRRRLAFLWLAAGALAAAAAPL